MAYDESNNQVVYYGGITSGSPKSDTYTGGEYGSLVTNTHIVSELIGGDVNFTLNAGPKYSLRNYLFFGGISGTTPGITIPGEDVIIPINWDLVTNIVISYANSAIFQNFMGQLDVDGMSNATFCLPPTLGFAGTKLYFAYALVDSYGNWDFASNPVTIEIIL